MKKQYIKPAGSVVELHAEQMMATSIRIHEGQDNEVGADESYSNKQGFGSENFWDNYMED